ncbi:MAG: redoxin domain-containing protein [Acidobacteria bacterium]|nr:redoxin domain-containing protein [Acidobacteriota bacterium]
MKRSLILSSAILIAFTGAIALRPEAQAVGGAVLGQPAPEFALKDLSGRVHRLSDYRDKPAVIAFISAKCPVSNDYNERLRAFAEQYTSKGVTVLGINSSSDETVEMIREHAERHGFGFPVLKDEGNAVADAYGAVRTPEVYATDGRGILRYHGRIDNSRDPSRIRRSELREAVEALIAGKDVATPEAKAFGCLIKRAQTSMFEGLKTKVSAQGNASAIKLIKPAGYAPLVKETTGAGKVLVVNFWATWCGPCVAEFPEFVELDHVYRSKGVRFVGISADEVSDLQSKVAPFVKEKKVGFEIFVQDVEDPQDMIDVVDKKWEGTLPATFVYDKKGEPVLIRYGIINRDTLVEAIEKALKS